MKNTDLRIGNLVKWENELACISQILEVEVAFKCGDIGFISELQPLSIAEGCCNKIQKALIDAGLEHSYSPPTNRLIVYIGNRTIVCDFVHQIQNLYFALTGCELFK